MCRWQAIQYEQASTAALDRRMMLQVQDLHAVTPASFLEASGCVIHSLSYQQARNSRMAVGQVYLAEAGYLMGQAGYLHCCVCLH